MNFNTCYMYAAVLIESYCTCRHSNYITFTYYDNYWGKQNDPHIDELSEKKSCLCIQSVNDAANYTIQ